LNYPKSKADIIINLDTEKIDFPSEKSFNVKISKQHTNFEKKMITNILRELNIDPEEHSTIIKK
jgi:hypothetical protein